MPESKLQLLLTQYLGPEGLRQAFYLLQVALGAVFIGFLWLLRPRAPESGFAVREADLRGGKGPAAKAGSDVLASARFQKKTVLALEGIRIDGPPHEVLGVRPGAGPDEIQKAYRERMKQYHPDRVGRPGSREWKDAQQIAEAINAAKAEMLRRSGERG